MDRVSLLYWCTSSAVVVLQCLLSSAPCQRYSILVYLRTLMMSASLLLPAPYVIRNISLPTRVSSRTSGLRGCFSPPQWHVLKLLCNWRVPASLLIIGYAANSAPLNIAGNTFVLTECFVYHLTVLWAESFKLRALFRA